MQNSSCQRSPCLHPVSEPWLLCYPWASFWLWHFIWKGHMLEVFTLSSFWVWNQILWRNLQIRELLLGFLYKLHLWLNRLSESVKLWIDFSENIFFIFLKNFLNFWFDVIEKPSIINLSHYGTKSYALVVLGNSKVTFLGEGENAAFCPSLFCVLAIYGVVESKL